MLQGVLQTVTLPAAVDHMGPVCDPVQQCCSQVRIPEDLGPIPEPQVRRDDHRLLLMSFRENLKEELRSLLGEGNIAQLVNDQKAIGGVSLHHPAQELVVPGFDQLIGQDAARDKAGPHPLPAGLQPERGGQVGLSIMESFP